MCARTVKGVNWMLAPTEKSRKGKLKPNPRIAGKFSRCSVQSRTYEVSGGLSCRETQTSLRESSLQTNTIMLITFLVVGFLNI